MPHNNSNTPNTNLPNKTVKVAGYAQRVFFNDNIEYRNFSPDLVGFAVDDGGTTLFTNGNFSISANFDPKPDVVFLQGSKSKYFTLDDIEDDVDETIILKNLKTTLNLDLSNPLSYIWYGSSTELIKASLEEIYTNWPAAIYVDNMFGSTVGNNITNYVFDSIKNESTFSVSTNYLSNPYLIKFSKSDGIVGTEKEVNPLRNFTLEYKSYVVENGNIIRKILHIVPPEQSTNDILTLTVEGNPFPQLTGINIPQYSILLPPQSGSIPFFIKPNETKITTFFSSLNPLQNNLLNRNNYPQYKSILISPKISDQGVVITTKETLTFPILEDGYNLNFFDSYYLEYLDKINTIGENYDKTKTDLIVRKYTAEVINSFDTVPRGDGNDLVLNGEKATKLLRIYGVSFDEVKKYINGIKFAHVVTYNKKNNIPDSLVKELSHMLGLDPITFVTTNKLNKTVLPIPGQGEFSGTTKSLSNSEVDTELYRRLILNLAWLWKSKGSRKAVEFLFRFIGAPEALVKFDEYIVIVDKPLDMEKLKDLLYLYTGEIDTTNIPYDGDGFPLPPVNGDLVIVDFIEGLETGTTLTGNQLPDIVKNPYKEMYFQKAGGWYRETLGNNTQTILKGNNPHVGKYDGGNEYLEYFQQCYVPNFSSSTNVNIVEFTNKINHFINYNYGIFNGMSTGITEFYTTEMVHNSNTNLYDTIEDCYDIGYTLIESPLPNDGIYPLESKYNKLEEDYNKYLELIKESSYLRYSPEFIKIKNEFLDAKKQYEKQVNSENCEGNKALEICLTPLEVVVDSPKKKDCCDELTVVYNDGYFSIYEEVSGKQIKVVGEKLKCCCEKQEYNGEKARYVSYSPPNNDTIVEYCAVTSPCNSQVAGIREDGKVEFASNTSNNQPTYQLSDGNFYEFNGNRVCRGSLQKFILKLYPNSNGTTGDVNNDVILYGNQLLSENSTVEFNRCFLLTNNNNTTIYSSPECCAWHGYDSEVIQVYEGEVVSNYVVCIDNSVSITSPVEDNSNINIINKRINKITQSNNEIENNLKKTNITSNQREELITEKVQNQQTIKNLETEKGTIIKERSLNTKPNIEVTYNKYEPYTNRNTQVEETISVNKNKSSFDNSSVVRTLPNTNGNSVELYSPFEDADLNDTKNWEVESIDDLGRVSFSTIDKNNNKQILDWNSTKGGGNELYANVGKDKGYVYDQFELDYSSHRLQPIAGTKSKKTNKPTVVAVVDSSKISCEDVNKVNILFGSENYMGFKLPTDEDCECDINISLDYMLKYNANSLKNCLGGICNIGIINDLTINSLKCRNFLVFTNDESIALTLEGSISTNTEEQNTNIEIWQNTIQIEPSIECCNALGGEIINSEQTYWTEINVGWTKEIENNIDNIRQNGENNLITSNTELNNIVNSTYKVIDEWENYKETINNCISIDYPNVDFNCLINVNDYITTTQICALKLPNDCGIYTYLSEQLTVTETHLNYAIIKLQECVENKENRSEIINEINKEIINDKTKINTIKNNSEEETRKINTKIKTIDDKITVENDKIKTKSENSQIIDIAIQGINPQKDCTIYQQTITQLNSFNIKEFCQKSRNSEECIKTKTESINAEIKSYSELLTFCQRNNTLNKELVSAKEQNNQTKIDYLVNEININDKEINSITEGPNGVVENNINLQKSKLQENDKVFIINKTAELLGEEPQNITNKSGDLELSTKQQLDLKIQKSNNINEINKITTKRNELEEVKKTEENSKKKIEEEKVKQLEVVNEDINVKQNIKDSMSSNISDGGENCCHSLLSTLTIFLEEILNLSKNIEEEKIGAYNRWSSDLNKIKNDFNYQNGNTYIDYMDDLKVNFNLFVKQSNGNTSKLPYTNDINPVWEWNPTENYSGIIIGNDNNGNIEQDILYNLIENNIQPSDTLFDPQWQTIKYNLPNCVCETLKVTYPNSEFYFSLEIENVECDVCVIVDNIEVNISDCDTQKEITLTNCLIPELSCVIDNKKSWVYNTTGIEYQTIYPDGECNTGSTNNYEITKLIKPEERLWQELEYRYTEYNNPHSDLIMNTKSTVFAIDPANAIECDVYNFWKNIDCEECPTSCDLSCYILGDNGNFLITEDNCSLLIWCNVDSDIINYSGVLRETPSDPLSGYTITLTGCSSDDFNYVDYLNFLEYKVDEMKNEYYSLTGEYNQSLNSTYYEFKDIGGTIENFGITKNNCGSDTIVMGNFKDINEKFGLLVEDINGYMSLFEVNVFDELTPSLSGVTVEILQGYSAQTFNQTEYLDKEFCDKINLKLNSQGKEGFGLGKNYIWNEEYSACTWTDIDEGEGDCTYCGTKEVIDRRVCLPRCPEGYEYDEVDNNCKKSITEYRESEDYEPCLNDYEYIKEETEEFCRKTEIICPIGYEIVGEEGSQYCEKIEVEDAIEEIPDPTIDCGITDETPAGGNDGTFTFYRNLGTDMGEVVFEFNAAGVPDRFIVEWDGQVVIDTGYVGLTGYAMGTWSGKTYNGSVYSGETYLDGLVLPAYSPQPSPNITYTTQGYDGPAGSQGTQQDIDVISLNGVFDLQGGAHPFYNDASLVQRYNSVNGTNLTVNDLSGTNRGLDLGPLSGETGWSPTVFYYGVGHPNHPYSHSGSGTGTAAFIKDKKIGQKYLNDNGSDFADDEFYDVKITVLSADVVGGPGGTGWKFKLRCVEDVVGITEVATVPGFYCEDDTFTLVEEDGVPICKKSITANTENEVTDIEIIPAPIVEYKTTLVKEASNIEKYTATTETVCVNPKDYLDVNPKDINVKETFDDLIISNLIDAKSRQVISNYPMLQLFYQLYLKSNNCGKDFTGKLTYNDLFNFMDKIGDYWLDLLEQVVPATTIWEGCDNSGKLYRNTIFDQNKYQYRRYVLNYNDSNDCELSGISENIIASASTDVTVTEYSLQPINNKTKQVQNKLTQLITEKENLLNKQEIIENRICALELQDDNEKIREEITSLEISLKIITEQLDNLENQITNINSLLKELEKELSEQQSQYQSQIIEGCKSISDTITQAEKDLYDLYAPYTTSYERQRDYIAGLKNKYKKCIRKTQTQTSKYDTIFITQIYDSNEYEGNVSVIGDSEWEVGGAFYNNSLIHDCTTIRFNNRA
tara:strand:- start:8033 stop:17353 length:9321 start_codon:yes stop_codon:yes gene_type:complete